MPQGITIITETNAGRKTFEGVEWFEGVSNGHIKKLFKSSLTLLSLIPFLH